MVGCGKKFPTQSKEILMSAVFSACRTWRYRLDREFIQSGPTIAFGLHNPSTADENTDDPTLRRGIGFARTWGAGRLIFVNPWAGCATNPKVSQVCNSHLFALLPKPGEEFPMERARRATTADTPIAVSRSGSQNQVERHAISGQVVSARSRLLEGSNRWRSRSNVPVSVATRIASVRCSSSSAGR
jgi:hypothetical protein